VRHAATEIAALALDMPICDFLKLRGGMHLPTALQSGVRAAPHRPWEVTG
jgi:hypothetical protein